MKPKTMILMAVAITCGLGASYMTSRLLAERSQQEEVEKVKVLVLKKNMNTGDVLKNIETIFEEKEFLRGQEPRDAIVNANQLKGKVLMRALRTGDFIRPDDLLSDKIPGISPNIPAGHRAVGIRVNTESIAGGFASLPHSRVDIINTVRGNATDGGTYSQVLLENILVLAVDQSTHRDEMGRAMPGNVVTVALKPEDTLKVSLAKELGNLTLVLRKFNATDYAGVTKVTAQNLVTNINAREKDDNGGNDPARPPALANLTESKPLVKEGAVLVEDPTKVAKVEEPKLPKGKLHRMHVIEGPRERFVDYWLDDQGKAIRPNAPSSEPAPPRPVIENKKDNKTEQ